MKVMKKLPTFRHNRYICYVFLVPMNVVFISIEDNTIQEINCYKDVIVSGYKEALNTVYYITTQVRLLLVGNSRAG